MNVPHPEMIRQGVPNMHQPIMPQSLFPQQPQHGQQPHPHNLGLLQNNQGANPGLGIMPGQPGPSNPNYPMVMQQGNPPRQPMFMRAQPNGSGLHPGGGGGPPHMAGLAPAQMQNMQGMGSNMGGYPGGGMVPQQTVRRVQSQPLAQGGAHIGAMQPGMIGGGMGGMNGSQQMGGITRMTNHNLQMRPQPSSHPQGGSMSPEMSLPMVRPASMNGAPSLQVHTRASSGSHMMPTLTQPVNLAQGHAMQHFGNPMSLPHQHQQSQMVSSTHVGPSGQQPPNMGPQTGGNRMVTPDNTMFMSWNQNPPTQSTLSHGVQRMPMEGINNGQFSIAHSPSPMNAGGDMSQPRNPPMNPSGVMTPAQALGQMNHGGESFPTGSYGMAQPTVSAPPRPPSHNGPHNGFPMPPNTSQPTQRSPRQPDHLSNPMHPGGTVMQRPQSQPQVSHRQSPIPPNPVRTPRSSQPSLPMNTGGMPPPQRVPTAAGHSPQGPPHQSAQPPASAPPSTHPAQVESRPPSATAARPGARTPAPPTNTAPAAGQQSNAAADANQPQRVSVPPSTPSAGPSAPVSSAPAVAASRPPIYPIGLGQGINLLLQLSGALGVDSKQRLNMSYWTTVVSKYFSEKATMKLTLWKDNQQVEAKPFEIGYPIFPRFFLVTSQSGVKTQTLTIDGARERLLHPMHAVIECATAQWTFRYTNGYSITLRGPFTAEISVLLLNPNQQSSSQQPVPSYALKVERLQFDAFWHDKYLAFDAIQGTRIPDSPRVVPMSPNGAANGTAEDMSRGDPSQFDEPRYLIENGVIPAEPINAFGIPQATMRCLELAESVAQMSDLIQFSVTKKLGPCDALRAFADKIREEQAANRGSYSGNVMGGSTYSEPPNGIPTAGPSTSLGHMGSAPAPSQPTSSSDQQNVGQLDGAGRSAKATPQSAQASGSTPSASTPASAPTPGGPTTPSMANASLKRKAPSSQRAGDDPPTTANSEPQPTAKRGSRKRTKTQGS
ncbi:LIM-domain binding protein-domain-containing protein [Dichomitus squalens]|uniref:LIM-domain binding protein-domain-containing protein n=1 Tax=Dichomitus squalens TaxID=114155 RepID=A0A4Q9ML08_9APHY|nr:LIM-domain binding protein-domain-containing protein [Dichomitus squalens]